MRVRLLKAEEWARHREERIPFYWSHKSRYWVTDNALVECAVTEVELLAESGSIDANLTLSCMFAQGFKAQEQSISTTVHAG